MALTPEDQRLIEQGQQALYWARVNAGLIEPELPPEPEPEVMKNPVKIWPELIAPLLNKGAAIGGAVRIYFFARDVDQDGRGWVSWGELTEYLDNLGVGERKRRRWIAAARKYGLFREEDRIEKRFFITSLAGCANLLGSPRIGNPVFVSGVELCGFGWKSIVWAGVEALHPAPMAQTTKQELFGVNERTQRNYLKGIKHKKIKNLASHGAYSPEKFGDLVCNREGYFYPSGNGKFITQKLPDTIVIDSSVAAPAPRGRSRKAQTELSSSSCHAPRGKDVKFRLLFDDHESAGKHVQNTRQKIKRLGAKDLIKPFEEPTHIFTRLLDGLRAVNFWEAHAINA